VRLRRYEVTEMYASIDTSLALHSSRDDDKREGHFMMPYCLRSACPMLLSVGSSITANLDPFINLVHRLDQRLERVIRALFLTSAKMPSLFPRVRQINRSLGLDTVSFAVFYFHPAGKHIEFTSVITQSKVALRAGSSLPHNR
jgi:hypothetical protein